MRPHLGHGIPSEFGIVKAVSCRAHHFDSVLSVWQHVPVRTDHRVKAILCTRAGTPDDLLLTDIPEPVAGPGEVVTTVKSVGLNFYDTLIIAGRYQNQPPFPFSPGGEFAGVVESVGNGVSGFAPGATGSSGTAAQAAPAIANTPRSSQATLQ